MSKPASRGRVARAAAGVCAARGVEQGRWWGLAGRWGRWAAVPFGAVYLVLLAAHFKAIVAATYLDADTASAPVIGQLFHAGSHASAVLGTFGWYSTLLFELGTRWLPFHREIWEAVPYGMALGAAVLTGWSVWRVAGLWAAGLAVVLMLCAAPRTLHLLLSMTEHGPDWFCVAVLGAYLVLLELEGRMLRLVVLVPLTVLVGVIIGVNGASDSLVLVAGVIPFLAAACVTAAVARDEDSALSAVAAVGVTVITAVSLIVTRSVMSSVRVRPGLGPNTSLLATVDQIARNLKLWWQSIAVLGNGNFFGAQLSLTSWLAIACAALTIAAVVLLPRLGWRELRSVTTHAAPTATTPARLALIVFWCSSAILLTAAFLLSSLPQDINADRYLVGLIYAVAAVIPVVVAGRVVTEAVTVLGVCLFGLAAVISMARGAATENPGVYPHDSVANTVNRLATQSHAAIGYAGYWDAAPITWATNLRVRVYPVETCGGNAHLCPFYLHYMSSWYTPRPGIRTFLLTDPARTYVSHPTPDLGRPSAVYHIGEVTMFVYPYDIATRFGS